jgi:hypothetical protein
MRLDLVALAVGLILILAFDGLLSAARAALMNSHTPTLRSMEARGVPGASRALQLASEATSLLISFGVVQYLARLSAVALALAGWMLWAEASALPLGGLGILARRPGASVGLSKRCAPIAERTPPQPASAVSRRHRPCGDLPAVRGSDGRRAGISPLVTEDKSRRSSANEGGCRSRGKR